MIAVKVHGTGGYFSNQILPRLIGNKPVFGAVILLIRNPRDVLIADWHRRKAKSHYLHVNATYFGKTIIINFGLWMCV